MRISVSNKYEGLSTVPVSSINYYCSERIGKEKEEGNARSVQEETVLVGLQWVLHKLLQ